LIEGVLKELLKLSIKEVEDVVLAWNEHIEE
jgi:hypothetical protein